MTRHDNQPPPSCGREDCGKRGRRRGSALVTVFIISTCVALVAASAMSVATSERRINVEASLVLEARNAAEAVAEYGMADLAVRFDSTMAFDSDILAPKAGGNPLTLPDSFYDLFGGSNLSLPEYPYNAFHSWGSYDTELVGGTIPDSQWRYISSETPGNEDDPLKDKLVLVREVVVYGKATVTGPNNRSVTAYCSENLQVRDAPLFSHAIFYNMNMEIAPGPAMTVVGSVHANGNMYVQTDATLRFKKNVTASGSIYHGTFPGIGKAVSSGDVSFPNQDGTDTSMKVGGTWYDSAISDWAIKSSQRWSGNVQDVSHGILPNNAVALEDYVRDDPSTATLDDALNYGYNMIMPLDYAGTVDDNIEEQKFSYQAGLYIVVTTSSGNISDYDLYTIERDADGKIVYSGNTPVMHALSVPAGVFTVENFANTYNSSTKVYTVTSGLYDKRRAEGVDIFQIDMGALRDAIHDNDSAVWGSAPEDWWNGIIYVQFDYSASDTAGADGIRKAVDCSGVKLVNAQSSGTTPGIPDPANPNVGAFTAARGTTIATNNVLYVEGNYNSDGLSGTGNETNTDSDDEPPAALAADAIVILSENWNDTYSQRPIGSRVASTFTEVSAAFLTGIAPSDKANNNAYSGGVENFPRFLEDWNTTFRYRGSMVALFESEVSCDKWGLSDVYDAPTRNWGFNRLFSEGLYPPGTPNTRTYRRVNFRNLSAAEWNAALDQLRTQMGL